MRTDGEALQQTRGVESQKVTDMTNKTLSQFCLLGQGTWVEEREESELMNVSIVAAIDGLEDDVVCLMDVDFLFGALSGWRQT
jgi:hypothetical protein